MKETMNRQNKEINKQVHRDSAYFENALFHSCQLTEGKLRL